MSVGSSVRCNDRRWSVCVKVEVGLCRRVSPAQQYNKDRTVVCSSSRRTLPLVQGVKGERRASPSLAVGVKEWRGTKRRLAAGLC